MRNLKKHPITLDEIIQCLDRLEARETDKERIGDMTPLLLQEARKIVMRAGFTVSGIKV